MANAAKSADLTNVTAELEAALNNLDTALAQASRSTLVIRSNMAQVASMTEVVREMETAITLARQSLSVPLAGIIAAEQPALHAVPAREESAPAPAPAAEAAAPAPIAAAPEQAPPQSEARVSHCLRLGVTSKGGSLDLKAVDGSVNENPAVVDVALLDYDGRQATLKLWLNQSADPVGVRDALLGSLRRRLGDEGDADVRIEFEEVA